LMSKTKSDNEKDKRIAELEKKLASLTLQDVLKKPKKKKMIVEADALKHLTTIQEEGDFIEEEAKQVQKKKIQLPVVEPVKEETKIKTAVYRGRGRKRN